MDTKLMTWSNLKVGIVIFIGLIIFVFVVTIVGTEQNLFTPTYTLKLFMPNVHGLVNGGMVALGGLKIGYVRDMQFTSKDGVNGVAITMSVVTKYRSTITTGSVAQIKTIGLLGDKYIDISIGNRAETALAEDAFVPLLESFDLEDAGPEFKTALADFSAVLRDAKRITASVARGQGSLGKFVEEPTVAQEMERFLRSLNSVMTAIQEQHGSLGKMVYDPTLSKNIQDISANLTSVTQQLRQGKGTFGKLLMDDTLYRNLSSFAARGDSLLGRAEADSSNVSRIISDKNFYAQILSLMKDLNILITDMKEHPERYVHVSVF
jgi:phospholipid/cholesterol/gamma-HCH transport system substrate-binding protein